MMQDPATLGVVITVVSAALGLVWRSSSVTTKVEVTLEQLRTELARVASMGDAVARIPVIETRLSQHDDILRRAISDITELKEAGAAQAAIQRLSQGEYK